MYVTEQLNKRPVSYRPLIFYLNSFIKDSKTGTQLDTDYFKHRLFTTIDVVLFYDKWKLREIYYEPENKRKQLG